MIHPNWVILSTAIALAGSLRYAYLTVRGRSTPNLVTWTLWAAAPLIAFFAQLDAGVGLPALTTLSAGVGPLIVLAASFIGRHRRVRLTAFDVGCGVISVIALVVWAGAGQAEFAVVLAVAADAAAALPTVRKAWRDPASENAFFYGLVGTGGVITLLTISDGAPASWAFAAYILALSVLLTAVITIRGAVVASRSGAVRSASVAPFDKMADK